MKLDHGYYWISYRGQEPRISRWDGMFWQSEHDEACEGLLRSENVQLLSPRRIRPPAAVMRKAAELSI